jgi:hypothetical protein
MDKTKDFLYFIEKDEKKVLAIKVTSEWDSCQAFIYDMESKKVDVYEHVQDHSFEKSFFTSFLPDMDSVKTKMKGNELKKFSWKWHDYSLVQNNFSLINNIKEKANEVKISTVWKDTFEYFFKKQANL